MKRIKEACICQTLHFMLKEDVGHDYAVRVVQEEIKKYKESTLFRMIPVNMFSPGKEL